MPAVAPSWLSLQPMQGIGKLSYCSHHSAMLCVYMYVRTYVQLSACHACVCVRHNVAAVPLRVTASCSSLGRLLVPARRMRALGHAVVRFHACCDSDSEPASAPLPPDQPAALDANGAWRRLARIASRGAGSVGSATRSSSFAVVVVLAMVAETRLGHREPDVGIDISLTLPLCFVSLSLLSVLPLTASQSRGEPFLHPIPKTRSRSARGWPGPLVPAAMEGASPPPRACSVSASLPARIVSRTGTGGGRGPRSSCLSSCMLLRGAAAAAVVPVPEPAPPKPSPSRRCHHPPPPHASTPAAVLLPSIHPSIHPDSHPSLPDGAPPWSVLDTDFREPPRTPSSARFVRPPRWREPPGWAGGSVAAAAPGVACLARLPHSFAGSLTVAAMSNGLELGNGCRVGCVKYRGVQGTVRMDKQQTDRHWTDRQTATVVCWPFLNGPRNSDCFQQGRGGGD